MKRFAGNITGHR